MHDEKEVTIANTHVPDKLYGYGLQVRQMLYELLNCGIDSVVKQERQQIEKEIKDITEEL